MELTQKLDDYGMPAWIGVMVLGFIVFWPIGLALLAYLIWSGRMGCWKGKRRWRNRDGEDWKMGLHSRSHGFRPSGNRAFDEYREDTLKRLEDEQKEFTDFLEKLRMAKDKVEFDQFMADRRSRPTPPPSSSEGGGGSGRDPDPLPQS